MLIRNLKLLNSIENAIFNYNNQPGIEEDINKQLPYFEYEEDGKSANVPEETLKKINVLRISLLSRELVGNEVQNITDELSQILDIMQLSSFHFAIINKGKQTADIDLSFIEHLNPEVKNLSLSGVNCSKEKPKRFEKFKNLNNFSLEKCNITNPSIISEIDPKVFISLKQNHIMPEHYNETMRLIQRQNGRIEFTDSKLKEISNKVREISQIYSTKRVQLSDYLNLMGTIDFDSITDLTVEVDREFDFENSNIKEIVDILNKKNNISLSVTTSSLSKLDINGNLEVPTEVVIRNASELTQEYIEKHSSISLVKIVDGKNTNKQQSEPYTREEYRKIRKEIDEIISQVEFPEKDEPNREKKIFAQIYKILGKRIEYDSNALLEEEQNNKRLQTTCRNMIGPILYNKGVCGGYADTLRNVLEVAGIHSEMVSGMPDFENGVPMNRLDPHGHAWNLVLLDGSKYWVDLTWDEEYIKYNRYPLKFCLKSTSDFKHDMFKKRLEDERNDPATKSISEEEQMMLFTGKQIEGTNPTKSQEHKNIEYMSNYVMSIADSGLTATSIRQVANDMNKALIIGPKKEVQQEVENGRS